MIARLLMIVCGIIFSHGGSVATEESDVGQRSLVGRIWNVHEARFVSTEELVETVSREKIVLLGETHDNRAHHELQLFLLQEMILRGLRPALVMEQFDREFQAPITKEEQSPGATPEHIFQAGNFSRNWGVEHYRPLVALAVEYKLPIIAGNVSRDEMCAIIRDPSSAVLPEVSADVEAMLAENIKRSHGGGNMAPELLAGVVKSQRARDSVMAEALAKHALRGAVLIAGAGHVRRDRGAPLYLRSSSVVVAFVEVDPSLKTPPEYFDGEFTSEKSFDYMWFTNPAEHSMPSFSGFCKK